MSQRAAVYSFRFPHHGVQASYHRLLDYLPSGSDIIDISNVRGAFWNHHRLNRIWFRCNELRLLPRFFSQGIGCVHYLYPENSLFTAPRWNRGKPLVLTWHQPVAYLHGLPAHARIHAQTALQGAAAVIFLSSQSRDEHTASISLRSAHVIKHGIDTDYFTFNEPVPRTRPLNIATVGSYFRDHEFWADTVRQMLKANPNVTFQVICNRQSAQHYKAFLQMDDPRISFLRNLTDGQLLSFYKEADIAFLPLKAATANNFLLESMSSGLPCVVSDLPATREYAGNTALYFRRTDVSDAVQKLTSLTQSLSLRADLAFAARRKAENELSWPIIAGQHCDIYSAFL
jgi:glycosyltransferase involved in cell wall biosynthesis